LILQSATSDYNAVSVEYVSLWLFYFKPSVSWQYPQSAKG